MSSQHLLFRKLSLKIFPSVPVFLLICICLANGDTSSKKVSVSEVTFDSSVEDIQWCGPNHKTVLLKTLKGRLYRSIDSGRIWSEITDKLDSDASLILSKDPALVDNIIVNSVDKNVVVIVGTQHTHFISLDAAQSFRRLKHKSTIHSWHFHPTRASWALLSTWTAACSSTEKTNNGDECNHLLYVTKDFGKTFSLLAPYVVQFSWGDVKMNQQDTIYFTSHKLKSGNQPRYGGWSKNVDFSSVDSLGKSVKLLVAGGNKFLVSNGFTFVAKLENSEKQTVSLIVSSDGGLTFGKAKMPIELLQKSYTVLDTSEGAIILHVNHGEDGKSNTGNVYISDSSGLRYSLSLPGNVRTSTGECEFDKAQSLEGVYIANFKDSLSVGMNFSSADSMRRDKDAEKEEEEAIETEVEKKKRKISKSKSEEVVRTVITLDKGGMWRYLTPPKIDSRGKPVECASPDHCHLHLHGITNYKRYAPVYSVENAVGLLLGTGNVGSHLRYEQDEVNTYLSRDGGLTWVEAHTGPYIYEFGDHGGLIVMADDMKKTNQVVFSWNEGQSWYDFELGQFPLQVDNIVIEPNSSSVEFLLYGIRGDTGVVIHLDFNALGQPNCHGVFAADSVSSDYETWTPTDGRASGEKCILGHQVTYTRRKQTSECFNGQDFQRPVSKFSCPCAMNDYECEVGFTRSVGSSICKQEDPNLSAPGCTSSNYFFMDAYRKVPGDDCTGGWVPEKVAVPCPYHAPFSRGAKTVLIVGVVIIAVLAIITHLSRSDRFGHIMNQYADFSNVKYSVLGGPYSGKGKDGDYDGSHPYEPELGFIDSEQDEHEEDVPTLLNYTQDSERHNGNEDFEMDIPGSSSVSRRAVGTTDPVVPRLNPPPSSRKLQFTDNDVELL